MVVYENNLILMKISHLTKHVPRVNRIPLHEALLNICVNLMYERSTTKRLNGGACTQKLSTSNLSVD